MILRKIKKKKVFVGSKNSTALSALWAAVWSLQHSSPLLFGPYSTAQHSTAAMLFFKQHGKAQHSTAQHSTAQHSRAAVLCCRGQRSTAMLCCSSKSTAQHSTAQHSTAQHSTAGGRHNRIKNKS